MNLLYKDKDKVITSVDFKHLDNNLIKLYFSADCGKFGTDESLDSYTLTPSRLLQILQEREDITDIEND